mmetsp:Transcript_12496/g.30326  ORF Transcript_12496/g.30326 Transcript_12496/m.30326 type:complete len:668 (-) Transcript_12496:2-2005(-)
MLLGREREAEAAHVVREFVLLDQLARHLLLGVEGHERARALGVRATRHRAARLLAQLADVEVLEELPGLGGVHGLEVLGGVGARVHGDARGPARVLLEVGRRVVDLATHHDPRVVLGLVLLHLLHRDHARAVLVDLGRRRHLHAARRHRALDHREGGVRRVAGELLNPLVVAGRRGLERELLGAEGELIRGLDHPPARARPRDRRVLEPERQALVRVERVHLHLEVRVVPHAHHVPREAVRLGVAPAVPCAHAQLAVGRREQLRHVRLVRPKAPAPVVPAGGVREVLHHGEVPGVATVEGDLHAADAAPAPRVRVASHRVLGRRGRELDHLAVRGRRHGRVEVELVEEVLGLVPPPVPVRDLLVHLGGQDAVVEEVVVVIALLLGDHDLGEPLDHAPADPSRDDHAHGVPVVGHQPLPVLLVRDDDVTERVHRMVVGERGPVEAVGELVGALEAHEVGALRARLDARLDQEVPERNAGPVGARGPGGAPVEANGLLGHVLLFAAVARARDSDREGLLVGHVNDVLHRDGERLLHEPRDLNGVGIPVELRHGAVVANEVERGRRDHALIDELRERRLDVVRVPPRQPNHRGVPRHPLIRGVNIASIDPEPVLIEVTELLDISIIRHHSGHRRSSFSERKGVQASDASQERGEGRAGEVAWSARASVTP